MWVNRTKRVLLSVWAGIQEGSLVRVFIQEKPRRLKGWLAGDAGIKGDVLPWRWTSVESFVSRGQTHVQEQLSLIGK